LLFVDLGSAPPNGALFPANLVNARAPSYNHRILKFRPEESAFSITDKCSDQSKL